MELAAIIAAARVVTALGATLMEAIDRKQRGEELTPEQQAAVTQARKLSVQNVDQAVAEAERRPGE